MTFIKLNHITKKYSSVSVLKEIELELKSGDMLAIMGASGSGKSTLMNIIGLLDRASSGEYIFLNQSVSTLTLQELAKIRNQKIGFIFQSFYLLPKFSILENVMLPLFYRGLIRSEAKKQALRILEKVGLLSFARQKPQILSGGQQQRAAIARALVGNPEIILADEPTGSLDSKTGEEIMNLLVQLNQQERRTILMITHDLEMSKRCQQVQFIRDGKLSSI